MDDDKSGLSASAALWVLLAMMALLALGAAATAGGKLIGEMNTPAIPSSQPTRD